MEEEKKHKEEFNEKEFLKKVEQAASKGAGKAGLKNSLLSALPTVLIVAVLAFLIVPKINAINNTFKSVFKIDESVEGHDFTLENGGIFGYTAADFEEAILGDSEKTKKIEVYTQEVSDAGTITDTGLFNLGVFTKSQVITYNGTVIYTVDLSKLTKSDISIDEKEKIITLKIPHAEQGAINIPREKISYSDPEKGLLAIGELKATAEKINEVEMEAQKKMQEKLDSGNVLETADRFAKLVVWEMYSPIIKGVAKDYSLEVEFK